MAKKKVSWKLIKPAENVQQRWVWPLPSDPNLSSAVKRWLEQCRARYINGDKTAVFDAIMALAAYFPPWLREGFNNSWLRYWYRQAATLDEAFGFKRRKQRGGRAREQLRVRVLLHVYERNHRGEPIDGGMFDRVGEELGCNGRLVAEIFGEPQSDALRAILQRMVEVVEFQTLETVERQDVVSFSGTVASVKSTRKSGSGKSPRNRDSTKST